MKRTHEQVGLPPGTVVFTGKPSEDPVYVHHVQYKEGHLKEHEFDTSTDFALESDDESCVDWYDIRGIHDTDLVQRIGQAFNIHRLILEDVVDVYQRPKMDEYESGLFYLIKSLRFDPTDKKVKTEHVGIYFQEGLVISFQEYSSDIFQKVKSRIVGSSGMIRQRGADYLAYALADVIVDNYFVVLEEIESLLTELESEILTNHENSQKHKMLSMKKELLKVRKNIAPLREALSQLSKTDSSLIADSTVFFLRDLYDHVIQCLDMVESFRDLNNGLQDLYHAELSFKMNQVMQVLTLVSTIFIPLTFLAGIYGMNFKNMPELDNPYGYYILLGAMLFIGLGLFLYFRKKRWL
jgi:magnesium transporter